MKKLLAGLAIFAVMCGAMAAEVAEVAEVAAKPEAAKVRKAGAGERGIGAKIGYYLLNRVLDFTDIVSLGICVGSQGSAEATVTDFCRFGFGYGEGVEVRMNGNRQYGIGKLSLADASMFCFTYDRDKYIPYIGTIPEYYMFSENFTLLNLDEEIYKFKAADRWAIGVRGGIIVNAAVNLHPVELADFLTGLVGYDLTGDDR